mgnify:FL=1
MGLSISYRLQLEAASPEVALDKLQTLHHRAADFPLLQLGPLVNLQGADCLFQEDDPHDGVKFGAMTFADFGEFHQQRFHTTPSCSQLIGFAIDPAQGSHTCSFGLASPAAQPGHWHWFDSCKTQYASNPEYGGIENFLRCHHTIIALLEICQELGILQSVSDPSGYWETRDPQVLLDCLRSYNIFTAAAIGSVKDALAPLGYSAQAPILERADFEHLEAEGRMQPPASTDSNPIHPAESR